ncbi:beta-ketoacyl-ACP synthase 3 [Adlercreutzia equolifaciens]|uniref:3-oxoacyl-ACP synthase III family protein n=1 Tax=Adlercreutzia equolifaciens TaxID=446660 RepID=UPI0023B130E7|nr:beta-ketoacyl-ACP synthase 3 [Adlercreutzia equolifaciens]MDE8702606.1 beta-ketoacyl-ACP synthase 3 [Adlercreutzia equolifaciens]
MGSVIIGSGKSLPKRTVTNDELGAIVDTSDEWIVPRTGIHTRQIALEETCTDLGAEAALRALGQVEGGWQRDEGALDPASLDLIICPTLTADTHFPSEAARIRERIGAVNAVCYDMSCACSGCVYGISTADLIMAGSAFDRAQAEAAGRAPRRNVVRRVLVVAAERLSRLVDWEDRATCILFGDGAGAVVLEWREDEEGVLSSYMENTDDTARTLWCDSAFCARETPFAANNEGAEERGNLDPHMRMAGQAVFKFATAAMMRCTEEALARAGLTIDDVTLFTPHQANERIIRYAAKKMDLPMERFQVIIDHVGNVSGASALIALNEALCEGKLKRGDIACMTAFGGGLTAGSCVLKI